MANPGSPLSKHEHLYKILVIGELGTGKTSIIKRYVHQFFSHNYRATIGVDFALKVLNWDANTIVRLQLWDIAGQERFGNMTRVYYKEAVGAFIVFDANRSATFDAVLRWKTDLDSKVTLPDGSKIPCVLLANKCDLQPEGPVADPSTMDEFCKEHGFSGWYLTSAKDNVNVEDAAKFLVRKVVPHITKMAAITAFMEDHPQLNKGAITNQFTLLQKERLWDDLTQKLNGDGEGFKCKEEWQKCWSDHKSEVKAKNLLRKKSQDETGGGQCLIEDATELELRVLALIGRDMVEESIPPPKVIPMEPVTEAGDIVAVLDNEPTTSQGAQYVTASPVQPTPQDRLLETPRPGSSTKSPAAKAPDKFSSTFDGYQAKRIALEDEKLKLKRQKIE